MDDNIPSATQDQIFLALVISDAFSVVPELFKTLGREQFLKFIDVYGGTTIRIPTRDSIMRCLRDVSIYQRYTEHGVDMKTLAQEYELSYHNVRRIILRVQTASNFGAQETEAELDGEKQPTAD